MKKLHSKKKHRLLFRHKNRLIAMTGMTVKGEEKQVMLPNLY